MNDNVRALAVSGNTLYAGGSFTTAGTATANGIAQWNGTSWSALGTGMNDAVWALAVSGSALYAGGYFTTAGGTPANHIAQWNGSSWSALGSGTDGVVFGLATGTYPRLFVGGDFVYAGTQPSPYIAQADFSGIQPRGVVFATRAYFGQVTMTNQCVPSQRCLEAGLFFALGWTNTKVDCSGVSGWNYALQRAADVKFTTNLITLLTNEMPSNGGFSFTDTNPPWPNVFYRLCWP